MLTFQIIFESLLAMLLVATIAVTASVGRNMRRLQQEKKMTYALVAMLERATSTAQAEAASLTRLVDMIRAERGRTDEGRSGSAGCRSENKADSLPTDDAATSETREDRKLGSHSEHPSL